MNGRQMRAEPKAVRCDRRTTGVVCVREGRYLLQGGGPAGFAPPAAHCDGLTWRESALAQIEQLALRAHAVRPIADGWRPDTCERPAEDAQHNPGHQWMIYLAEVDGDVDGAWWATRGELQALADVTVAFGHGVIGQARWHAQPGIRPVWLQPLVAAKLLTGVRSKDIQAVDWLVQAPIGGVR
jgi:hypothetical protein